MQKDMYILQSNPKPDYSESLGLFNGVYSQEGGFKIAL